MAISGIKDVKVLRLVSIDDCTDYADYADDNSLLYDITSNPNVEPWFHIAMRTSTGYGSVITKDGISYHGVFMGTFTDLTRIDRFTPEERLIVQEAIKRYVNEL